MLSGGGLAAGAVATGRDGRVRRAAGFKVSGQETPLAFLFIVFFFFFVRVCCCPIHLDACPPIRVLYTFRGSVLHLFSVRCVLTRRVRRGCIGRGVSTSRCFDWIGCDSFHIVALDFA